MNTHVESAATTGMLFDLLLRREVAGLPPEKKDQSLGQFSKEVSEQVRSLFFSVLKAERIIGSIEVGALRAETSRKVAKLLGAQTVVLALEANPVTYERVTRELDLARLGVDYRLAGVGTLRGSVTVYEPVLKDGSPGVSMTSLKKQASVKRTYNEYTVPACQLDDLLADLLARSGGRDLALWVDVEGAALEVLKSGPDVLRRTTVAYVELQDASTWEAAPPPFTVFEHMLLSGLVPVLRDQQHDTVWNCLFIADDVLSRHGAAVFRSQERVRALVSQFGGSTLRREEVNVVDQG